MIQFTIITCTFNAASVLQRTIDSIKEQTWNRVHHIIIDGASTDNTLSIANRYAEEMNAAQQRGTKVVVVSEPDNGLYDAMNKGLQMAKEDYVLFLNAGDKLHSADTLQVVANNILATKEKTGKMPGIIYGDTDIVDGTNHYVGKRQHQPPETLTWRSFKDGMLVCHQAFYVRTDIARKNAYNLKYRFSADVDWCIRVMKDAEKSNLELVNTHQVLCDFLAGGMSIQNHKSSLGERFNIMANHYGLIPTMIKHLKFIKNNL